MTRLRTLAILASLIFVVVASDTGAQQQTDFTFALTGDSIITRKLSVYNEPAFTRIIELVRGADAAFTNLEMLFHDYEPYPSAASGGTYMRAEPALAKELVWAGFDMVARANNHSGDYGVLGMNLTTKYVAEAGLVQAGVGQSLNEAREAKFLETAKARVALISVSSTFPDSSRAGKTRGDVPARPGLNPLRFETITTIQADDLDRLREIMAGVTGRPAPQARDGINFFGRRLVVGQTRGVRTEPNKEDLTEIAAVVKNASGLADYTIVTIHAHEGGRERTVPADFLVPFARAMVDAGADMFVGHGPHVLRGVEMYKGKPIMYSLGDFIFQNETLLRLPFENYEGVGLGANATAGVNDFNDARYNFDKSGFPADRMIWEAVVAMPKFRGDRLVELALHPITLGFGKSRSVRGRPMFAEGELGQKILGDITKFSAEMGTKITVRNGIGYVELPSTSSSQ
jgi:poly-gamma-glutamate synthesis protein (capsule biosynthesis protein)